MDRRQALKSAAYAAALFGLPMQKRAHAATSLPDGKLFERDPEAYWNRIRNEQFLLPEWRAFLNNGSLGICAKPVLDAVFDYMNRSAALNLEEYPRWGYETLDPHRQELADFFGCKKDELALMHNATEAMSTVANGLDLQSGDEVVTTDQEHPGGISCWLQRQARYGNPVRQIKLPIPPKNSEQLADVVTSSFGPRTRVVSFSGITTTTGLIMPIRQICDAARAKGIISVIDGAHMNGQVPVNFHELGCDFFAGSPHKWLFAPAGCGLLYGREEMLDRLWVNVATAGWDKKQELKAARFQMVGTNNRAIFDGLIAGLRFLKDLGPERVYGRIHQLSRMVDHRARSVSYVDMLTPEDDRLYGSLVTIRFKSPDLTPVWDALKQKRIWVLNGQRLRLSTHIHTRPVDIDLFFDTVDQVMRKAG
jgi:isopenicillin-N epimerase